ncbi:lymphokine-activated killer T-cell-originated protein kinase homolog [Halyomorpha halys]|uniref:lymphokine-activated killer T-cell-originated protein kinase homolog n=1 Tax=Halyomorpha halys TaxID=286706 RepID=UPI0006D4F485|nr:lymphokine-activated killer T-cell-originated protein kinase homolog [Halyomorpha halys]
MKVKRKLDSKECLGVNGNMKIIGYGTGVTIYRVEKNTCGAQRSIAMKMMNKRPNRNDVLYQRLIKEAEILKRISHPNIVAYLGCLTFKNRKVLLMEELEQSLGDYIERLEGNGWTMPPEDIWRVLEGTSKALEYLHTEKYLLHGDIKSHNILIKGDLEVVKLCDFGLSVSLRTDGTGDVQKYVGTLCWAAPEAVDIGPLTTKADIFALGMVVYEMLTLKVPLFNYCRIKKETHLNRFEDELIESENGCGLRLLSRLDSEYYSFIEIFRWCTEDNYSIRPSAKELLQVLESREFTPLRRNTKTSVVSLS